MKCSARFTFVLLLCTVSGFAQQSMTPSASGANPVVPALVNFAGTLTDLNGRPLSGVRGVTFLLYKGEQGGAPLWLETQNVTPDKTGRYTVQLGASSANGLPADLFRTGEARWLAVQVVGQSEQERVLLVAVPYAMKAADAETIGGLPPSAFVLAAPPTVGSAPAATTSGSPASAPPPASSNVTTTGGTANTLPLFTTATNIQNSVVIQTGSGATGKIGINTTAPNATLDVNGGTTVNGIFLMPATGTATAAGGKNSQPQDFIASAFNSGTSAAVPQKFQWQAEPAGNDTATASGTMNLLFAAGSGAPAETGLKISSKGVFTFAAGQTFPGTGNGTITGVTAGSDLTGGGTTGTVILNLDTTKVPLLATANTFTSNQTVNGNVSATGIVSGSTFQIGSNPIAFGSFSAQNAFLGFAGNATMTGGANTAAGFEALFSNTTGFQNTAAGDQALQNNLSGQFNTAYGVQTLSQNTGGGGNTAIGANALSSNVNGIGNTGLGDSANVGSGNLQNATAVGSQAQVTASNSLVLGAISGVNGSSTNTNVGIGTTAPAFPLTVERDDFTTTGVQTRVINDSSFSNSFALFSAVTSTGVNVEVMADGLGSGPMKTPSGVLGTFSNNPTGFITNNVERMRITKTGNVGIGTAAPDDLLTVNGAADKPGGGSWGTFSDRRLKTLGGSFNAGLTQVLKINPIRYRYKTENGMGIHDPEEHVGLVAQEVQKVIPEAVTENSQGYLLVNNDPIIWSMLNAIKEQQAEIAALRSQLRRQTAKEARLQTRVMQLEHGVVRETSGLERPANANSASTSAVAASGGR